MNRMHSSRIRRGFTLIELLVAMGIIAVLSTLTTVAVKNIANEARLSSSVNAVKAALDNARSLAMKNNRVTLVAFLARQTSSQEMQVEMVLAEWTGDSSVVMGSGNPNILDRFVPVEGIAPRRLSPGIKVAAPRYYILDGSEDSRWTTQPHLPSIDPADPTGSQSEELGSLIAVVYNTKGQIITRNPISDSNAMWVDLENEDPTGSPMLTLFGTEITPEDGALYGGGGFDYGVQGDEVKVTSAPFIAVFDDRAARDGKAGDWTVAAQYENELVGQLGYINEFAERIHFNRYSGVAMK